MTSPLLAALLLLPAAARAAEPAHLNAVEVEAGRVVLKLSRPAAFRIKAEADPPRLTVTLSDADITALEKDILTPKGMARRVSSESSEEDGAPAARVTIDLDSAREYEPAWSGNDLVLEFKGPPPAAQEPAPKAADPAARKRAFRVQFASLPNEKSAQALKAQLDRLLDPIEVRGVDVGGKTVYRVSMGPFPDRRSAAAALEKAAAKGQKGIITKD